MSCLLPELAWLYNNTNCKLSKNIRRAEGPLKKTRTERFEPKDIRCKIRASHSTAIFWDVVVTQRWSITSQNALILTANMHATCSMHVKNRNVYRIMV
jgi:hypothetical protein